jgi:hypothetical protein
MAGNLSVTRAYDRVFSIIRDELASNVIFDNVSTRTALLFCMKLKGAIVPTDGAPHLRFNILKELPTTVGYTDLDTLTPERADAVTSAVYEWKQLATPVQVSGLDMVKTPDGNEPDILETFIAAAETSMRESLGGSSLGIFSNADETDLRKYTGLQNILGTSVSTGTVGNLNRATLTTWRHQSGDASGDFSANGLNILRTLYRQCSRFDENPDTVVLSGSTMDNFERDLTSTFQVNLPIMGVGPGEQLMIDAGFGNIRYKGALVFADDGVPGSGPDGYMLNLNKYLKLYVRRGRESELGDFVKSNNRDDLVAYVYNAGNLAATNLALKEAHAWGTAGGDGTNFGMLQETAVFFNNEGGTLSVGDAVELDLNGTAGTTLGAYVEKCDSADSVLAVGVVKSASVADQRPAVVVTKGPIDTLAMDSADAVTGGSAVGCTTATTTTGKIGGGTNLGIALENGDATDTGLLFIWVDPTGAD